MRPKPLNIPTSTPSRRVSELERSVGMRLLNRSTRKIDLTEAGAIYFERCRHIVEEARVAHDQLLDMAVAGCASRCRPAWRNCSCLR